MTIKLRYLACIVTVLFYCTSCAPEGANENQTTPTATVTATVKVTVMPTSTAKVTVSKPSNSTSPKATPSAKKSPSITDVDATVDQSEHEASNIGEDNNSNYSVNKYLTWVVTDADKMWTAWFKSNGLTEPRVGFVIVQENYQYTTKCTLPDGTHQVASDHPNAYYCPLDVIVGEDGQDYQGSIILPVTTFQKMWNGDIFGQQTDTVGDFAAGGIAAHEFGHSITKAIGDQLQWTPPAGKDYELIADCFSGIWVWSINDRGKLESDDIDEIIKAFAEIGDQEPDSSGGHGTSQERVDAFTMGLNTGLPNDCINAYWQ